MTPNPLDPLLPDPPPLGRPGTLRLRPPHRDFVAAPATDDLTIRLHFLLKVNPLLKVRFRADDLDSLDDRTKRELLADIDDALGLRPAPKVL